MRQANLVRSFVLGAQAFTLIACTSAMEEAALTVPESIQGVWVTDDPDYAGQRLELMEAVVLFHIEEGDIDPYVVLDVKRTEEESGTLFEILHTGRDGGEMTISLRVLLGDSTLVFKNQQSRIWRKVQTGG